MKTLIFSILLGSLLHAQERIRVDLDLIEVSKERAILLSDFRKVQKAFTQGKATRRDFLSLTVSPGISSYQQSILELVYPTEYELSSMHFLPAAKPSPPPGWINLRPSHHSTFETRKVGDILECEVNLRNDFLIDLMVSFEKVTYPRDLIHLTHMDQWGIADYKHPLLRSHKIGTAITLENGRTVLLNSFSPLQKDGSPTGKTILVFVRATLVK